MSLSFIDVSNRALYLKILTDFASRSVRDFGKVSATISKLSNPRPESFCSVELVDLGKLAVTKE